MTSTHSNNEVSVSGGKLILSLPNAQTPVVWQINLESAQSSSFSISEDKKKKVFAFASKNENADTVEVACFEKKEDAVDILMKTSSALQNIAQIHSASVGDANSAPPSKNNKSDKYGAIIAFILVILLFFVWTMLASSNIEDLSFSGASGLSDEATQDASSRQSSGVPVSADDFLNNR